MKNNNNNNNNNTASATREVVGNNKWSVVIIMITDSDSSIIGDHVNVNSDYVNVSTTSAEYSPYLIENNKTTNNNDNYINYNCM